MMRNLVAAVLLGLGTMVPVCGPAALADYYCSPGFQATYGDRCVATASRDEIDLYRDEPLAEVPPPVRHRRHHARAARS